MTVFIQVIERMRCVAIEAMSSRASRHGPRRSSHSSEPMVRIPTVRGTGSLLVSFSSRNSRDNQFRYERRNILNHHESFPGQIIVTHRAIAIPKFLGELVSQSYTVA